jgi:hypothetical protein
VKSASSRRPTLPAGRNWTTTRLIRYDKRNRPYNANAGPVRNAKMVAAGDDMCLAFPRAISASKETKDCVRRGIAAGIRINLIDSDRAEPERLSAGDARLR